MSYQMDLSVKQKFETYPESISVLLNCIRDLIFSVAKQDGISNITETLKWGEPSYTSSIGSTIRFDWKAKYPDQYCIYFNCKTSLVDTFKEMYGDTFTYGGNRAIIFKIDQDVPLTELAHCISLSLRYKKIKHLDLLGA
tara:strand:- start:21656 stop:22072 length:417 start_codon:yes stop_codon:yes gene_type:complete